MKKSLKLLSILLTVVLVCGIMLVPVYASDPSEITPKRGEESGRLVTIGQRIYGAIFTVGIVASVIIVAVLGIRYMMGSTEDKSEYKKSMIPYLVGALCLFSASTIATIVFNLTKDDNVAGEAAKETGMLVMKMFIA